jgi:hypothetical protein
MMPSWKATAILVSWVFLVGIVATSALVTVVAGIAIWIRYGVRCPAIILSVVALLLVIGMSLPLFG